MNVQSNPQFESINVAAHNPRYDWMDAAFEKGTKEWI